MSGYAEILNQRDANWGNPVHTHVRIAQGWSGIFDIEVTPLQVAMAMDYLKTIRALVNPDDVDSFDDKHGYNDIGMFIAGHKRYAP